MAAAPSCEQQQCDTSQIVDFYRNRSILITGGSGFIGKVLIEKLLRTCPKVRRIFVLIRPKWNKQPSERLQELLEAPLFDAVRTPELISKVHVVEGDVTRPNLGMSEQNLLRIMNEVSVIYHSAATVKFDEPLKQSVAINIAGTKNMIDVCRKIPQLAALVHVSTAYANCDQQEVDEHVYPMEMCPEKLIEIANWLDQDTLQELKAKLLAARPNTYTYTKALAEWLLVKSARDLPIAICRPSIVAASWREPFSGWIDNVNGPTGVILGTGKGLVRTMFAQPDCVADLIPVDTVINLIITLGWFASVYRNHRHQLTDSAPESLSESLNDFGASSSGEDESLESISDHRPHHHHHHHISSFGHHRSNTQSSSGDNNNNNNGSSNDPSYHYADRSAGKTADHLSLDPITTLDHLHLDEGYSSVTCPTSSSSTSTSASPVTSPALTATLATSNQQQQLKTSSEITAIDSDQGHLLSFETQRRLAEQKHAAFEYKLKQFRHNTQVKLAEKNLSDDIADIPVFHCTSGSFNPITWNQIQLLIVSILALYPSSTTYRYPNGKFTAYARLNDFYRLTLHYIPAHIVDFITKLFGGKPVLVKIYKKFDQAANVLKAFTSKQWKFGTDNNLFLINELMSEEDKRLFNCDVRSLDWSAFLTNYVLGVRQHLLKEPISNLKQARANLRFVYYRNLSLQVLLLAMTAYYFVPTGWLASLIF